MSLKKLLFRLSFLFLSLLLSANVFAQGKPVRLIFWHAMSGHLGEEVRSLVDAFNQSQSQFIVKPVYKGDYVETMTSFAAAFRAHQAPAIVQIFEVGTAQMLFPKGIIKPVETLMQEQGFSLPKEDFISKVREFYSREGVLMAMPFNLSAPVLYYNLDILAEVGYSEKNMPRTWDEMEILAARIKKAGYHCTYTSAYPGWILFESFLAIHGLPLMQDNPARVVFNSSALKHHYERLKRWYDLSYFRYGGRGDDATVFFTSGLCPLFSQSSGAYNSLLSLVPFQMGVTLMPLDSQASTLRHANVAGGAALWALAGQTELEYKGIAAFFAFIAQPEVQKRWHEHTGYLPLGLKGVYADLVKNSQHPTLALAQRDFEQPLEKTVFLKFGVPQNQIRGINDEVLEALFAGLLNTNQALKEAVARSNHVLLRFFRNTKES